MTTERAQLVPLTVALAGARVLAVGDVMVDHFQYGTVDRISPEAPIPVLKVEDEFTMLGGAGNVAFKSPSCFCTFVTSMLPRTVERGSKPQPVSTRWTPWRSRRVA